MKKRIFLFNMKNDSRVIVILDYDFWGHCNPRFLLEYKSRYGGQIYEGWNVFPTAILSHNEEEFNKWYFKAENCGDTEDFVQLLDEEMYGMGLKYLNTINSNFDRMAYEDHMNYVDNRKKCIA